MEPPITTRVYAGNGTVLGEFAHERRIFVPRRLYPQAGEAGLHPAPRTAISTAIRAIDPSGQSCAPRSRDVRAWCCRGRRPQGASTITQQVGARPFLLNSDLKNWRRKVARGHPGGADRRQPIPRKKVAGSCI